MGAAQGHKGAEAGNNFIVMPNTLWLLSGSVVKMWGWGRGSEAEPTQPRVPTQQHVAGAGISPCRGSAAGTAGAGHHCQPPRCEAKDGLCQQGQGGGG